MITQFDIDLEQQPLDIQACFSKTDEVIQELEDHTYAHPYRLNHFKEEFDKIQETYQNVQDSSYQGFRDPSQPSADDLATQFTEDLKNGQISLSEFMQKMKDLEENPPPMTRAEADAHVTDWLIRTLNEAPTMIKHAYYGFDMTNPLYIDYLSETIRDIPGTSRVVPAKSEVQVRRWRPNDQGQIITTILYDREVVLFDATEHVDFEYIKAPVIMSDEELDW